MPSVVAGISLVYNNARWVCRALDAIARQSLAPAKMVVIDDGSKDDSPDVLRAYAAKSPLPLEVVFARENAGICARLNQARDLLPAEANLVFFCSDDLFEVDHLERAARALEAEPRAVAYFSAMRVVDGGDDPLGWRRAPFASLGQVDPVYVSGAELVEALFTSNPVGAPSVVMRAAALSEAGIYDERFLAEDFDMWFRLSTLGGWVYDPYAGVRYVLHGANLTLQQPHNVQIATAQVMLKHLSQARTSHARKMAARAIADGAMSPLVHGILSGDSTMVSRARNLVAGAMGSFEGVDRATFALRSFRTGAWALRTALREKALGPSGRIRS